MRVAIIGGGISGLAAAYFLRQKLGSDAKIVVFEKKSHVGGHLHASEVAGHPVDEGAESLLARRPEAIDLARAAGLGGDIVHPAKAAAQVWGRGRLRSLPQGTVMGIPAEASALEGLLTTNELADFVGDELDGMPIDDDISVGALVQKRLGHAVVDRLVDPLLGGVYAGRADQLSLDATVPALGAAARKETSLLAAVRSIQRPASGDPVFAGLTGGVGRLPGWVADAAKADIRTGTTVRELRRDADGWTVVTGPVPAPGTHQADAVVVAVPADAAARLLRGVVDVAARELAEIETSSMAIVTLALPASAFSSLPTSSGFLVPAVEGRTIKAVTYSSIKWPWLGAAADGLVILRASIGRHGDVADLQRDDDQLVDAVSADLHEMAGVAGQPVDRRVSRWGGALPQYAVGHLDRVSRIRESVRTVPDLAVCGAVYDGVGVAACIASAKAAVDAVIVGRKLLE